MVTSVSSYAVTIPAGTSPGGPASTSINVRTDALAAIRWRVPPGPRGTMGWALFQSGVQILPDTFGGFVIADDEWDTWPVGGLAPSGSWTVRGYNTGASNHTVYLHFIYGAAGAGGLAAPPADTGDITAGFPTSDSQIAGMWL